MNGYVPDDHDQPAILRDVIGNGIGVHMFRNRGVVSIVLVDDASGIPLPGTPSAEVGLLDLEYAVAQLTKEE